MKNYQNWCIEVLKRGLELGVAPNKGESIYTYVMSSGLIGQYAEAYTLNGEGEMKFWNLDYHARDNKGKKMWRVLLVSERCKELIEAIESGTQPLNKYPSDKRPYYEHCEPKSVTYKNLQDLDSYTNEKIKETMKYCKLFAITKEEAEFLDRTAHNNRFNEADVAQIKAWEPVIGSDIAKQAIDSMKDTKDTWNSCRSNGTAYARAAHLACNGVTFLWSVDPNPRLDKTQAEIIHDYLENQNRIWKTV